MSYRLAMMDEAVYTGASKLLQHDLPYDTDLIQDASLLTSDASDLKRYSNSENSQPEPVFDPNTGTLILSFHAASPGITYTAKTSVNLEHWLSSQLSLRAARITAAPHLSA